jgi:hypothetical protein
MALPFRSQDTATLIARINGKLVGHAKRSASGDGIPRFGVYLHPDTLPGVCLSALITRGLIDKLTAFRWAMPCKAPRSVRRFSCPSHRCRSGTKNTKS